MVDFSACSELRLLPWHNVCDDAVDHDNFFDNSPVGGDVVSCCVCCLYVVALVSAHDV